MTARLCRAVVSSQQRFRRESCFLLLSNENREQIPFSIDVSVFVFGGVGLRVVFSSPVSVFVFPYLCPIGAYFNRADSVAVAIFQSLICHARPTFFEAVASRFL